MHPSNSHIDFDSFIKSYYKAIYFFAWKYVNHGAVAEDIIESAFIKLWEKREQFETEAGMRGYLYKTVYHGCLKEISRQSTVDSRQKEYVKSVEGFEKDHLENMIRAETLRLVYEAMEKLPGECRKVFVKLFVEGKSVADAAAELGVAVSTVKNQKARGIRLLRMKLGLGFMVWGLVFGIWGLTHSCWPVVYL